MWNEWNSKRFWLAGDQFMPEMHLRKSGFTYSACWTLNKKKERIQKFKEAGDSQYICQNKLDETCFKHNMAYEYFKGLTRRATCDKRLHYKALNITKNPNHDGYQRSLASWLLVVLLKMKIYKTKN